MLTKNDLKALGGMMDEKLDPIKRDITLVKEDLVGVKKNMNVMSKNITTMKEDVITIKKDVITLKKDNKTIVNYFDNEYLDLKTKIKRIERVVNLPPLVD